MPLPPTTSACPALSGPPSEPPPRITVSQGPFGAARGPAGREPARAPASYLSGFAPAIQMITRVKRPSGPTSKKLQLCMSFFVPSTSSPT